MRPKLSNNKKYMSVQAAKKFKNFTETDFTWSYNSIPFTFKAGQEIYLEEHQANHFAKHLVDRELNNQKLPTNSPKREELLEKCFPGDSEPITTTEAFDIEEKKKEVKRGRPSKKVEKEFEDLN